MLSWVCERTPARSDGELVRAAGKGPEGSRTRPVPMTEEEIVRGRLFSRLDQIARLHGLRQHSGTPLFRPWAASTLWSGTTTSRSSVRLEAFEVKLNRLVRLVLHDEVGRARSDCDPSLVGRTFRVCGQQDVRLADRILIATLERL